MLYLRTPRARRFVFAAVALLVCGASAAAQLDLPDRPTESNRPRSRPRAGRPGLDLPSTPVRRSAPAPARGAPEPAADAAARASYPPKEAASVLEALRGLREPNGDAVRRAAADLVERGQAGLVAARASLPSTHPAEVVAAARVLLAAGAETDRAAVLARLRVRVPGRAASALVGALVELDPVAASPGFLVSLLDHRQGGVRSAAARRLGEVLDRTGGPEPSLVQSLGALRAASGVDTRARAVDLLSRAGGPAVFDSLVEFLGDSSARVASRAASGLARSRVEDADARLLELVRDEGLGARLGAYAALALVEREDLQSRAIFGDADVESLLSSLASESELESGAAACVLAGIGFRSGALRESGWLDLLVPHHLVRAVAAVVYHPDFSALLAPSQRRLGLISGQDFGSDGPAWLDWWGRVAPTFRARRAAIAVGPGEAIGLCVEYRVAPDVHFRVAGERAPRPRTDEGPGSELFRLSREECEGLLRVLERERVLTAERLPSAFDDELGASGAVRRLTVSVGERAKRFDLRVPRAAPWAERVVEMARGLRERNLWQVWLADDARSTDSDAWRGEQRFWLETRDPVARDRRLKALILAALPTVDRQRRTQGLEQLVGLGEAGSKNAHWDPSDVAPLVSLVRGGAMRADNVRRALSLAIRAARSGAESGGASGPPALDGGASLDGVIAAELIELGLEQLRDAAAPEVAQVLVASSVETVVDHADSPRATLRAACAMAFARLDDPASAGVLRELLDDDDPAVEAAAVAALGQRGVGDAVDAILERAGPVDSTLSADARRARIAVRAEALRALGNTADTRAVGVLLAGLSDPDEGVRLAAAEGMVARREPSTVPILVSMLGRGPEAVVFQPAREGLRALGAAAHDELLRAAHRRTPGLSREAALLLAEDGVAEAASPLFVILSEAPDDERVAWELAVLTCVDLRDERDPAGAWWRWWDEVVHDDSVSWMLAAGERADLRAPERAAFDGRWTREAAAFALDLMVRGDEASAERARRELSQRLDRPLGAVPRVTTEADWSQERERILDEAW